MGRSDVVEAVKLEQLDERYATLRLARPRQEQAVTDSLSRLGQLVPLVVCRREERLAVIDGFKRLRAARTLKLQTLVVRTLPLSEQAAVASIYSLNRHSHGLVDLEEAFVVRALVRDQALTQAEVAELLGRHASWVSRRLALVERLSEQLQCDIRVGLVSTTVAREISRLPRGNQAEVAAAIRKAALSSREAAVLVGLFEKATDRDQQTALLDKPRAAVERQQGGPAPPPWDARLSPATNRLRRSVLAATTTGRRALSALLEAQPASWSDGERQVLGPLLRQLAVATSALSRDVENLVATLELDVADRT